MKTSELNAKGWRLEIRSLIRRFRDLPDGYELKGVREKIERILYRLELSAPTDELAEAKTELSHSERVELWDAINDYAISCGARPDKHVTSIARQNAVAAVESVVRAALAKAKAAGGSDAR